MADPLLRLPPLDPLRGFVAAARHLSFTRAAQELCLTQSAVSRQIQTLEEALGVPLFRRATRRLELTPEGARLAIAAEGWLLDYARLARELGRPASRAVTVTAAIGVAGLWLLPRLGEFQLQHPGVEVRLAATNRVVDLEREDVDLALRYCRDEDVPPGARRLFGEDLVPVASPAVAEGLSLDADTLPTLTLLDYDEPGFVWLSWEHWLAAAGLAGIRPRARIAFSHYDQLIHMAVAGHGVALGRTALLVDYLRDRRLVALDHSPRALEGRSVWLIAAPGAEARAEVRLFADWLAAVVA